MMRDVSSSNSIFSDNGTSILGAAAILLNGIVGAGLIAIPHALKECGLFGGLLAMGIVAYTLMETDVLIISVGIREKLINYEDISEKLFGTIGYYLAVIVMTSFAFFDMLGYLVIIGDGMTLLYGQYADAPNRAVIIFLFSFFIILPLSLTKSMASLSTTALISILSTVVLAFVVIDSGPKEAQKQDIHLTSKDYTIVNPTLFVGLDVMSFIFVNHHGTALIYKSMSQPSLINWRRSTLAMARFGLFLCSTVGTAGYLCFGRFTNSNILNNYLHQDSVVDMARVMVSVSVMMTYPQDCYVARHCIISVIQRLFPKSDLSSTSYLSDGASNPIHGTDEIAPLNRRDSLVLRTTVHENAAEADRESLSATATTSMHVVVTLFLWMTAVIVAILCSDLGLVNSLNGALAGSSLGFIFPAAFYLKSHQEEILQTFTEISKSSQSPIDFMYKFLSQLSTALFCLYCIILGVLCSLIGIISVCYSYFFVAVPFN